MSLKKILAWLLTRSLLIVFFSAPIQRNLFDPFLSNPNLNLIDPWTTWMNTLGRVDAFPYGFGMYMCFIPVILLNKFLQIFSVQVDFGLLTMATLLTAEYFLYKHLEIFEAKKEGLWSWIAIFSPLGLFICYVHGQLDIIPTTLMTLGSLYVSRNRFFRAGVFVGLAFAAKFSFILSIPFFLIFFFSTRWKRSAGKSFLLGLMPGIFLFLIPAIFSKGYKVMVLAAPEVLKTLDAKINIGISALYIVPIAYLLVVLSFWNLNFLSSFILLSYIGAAYMVIALTQNTSVGWFYWGLSLILLTLRNSSNRTLFLFFALQSSITSYFVINEEQISTRFGLAFDFSLLRTSYINGLLFTMNLVVGAVLIIKILREAQNRGDIFSLAKKPLTLTVAGDSGVGKDTLSNEIARLFGNQEVALLLGDDYHLHERGDTSWLTTTHLSPDANDLEGMGRDLRRLLNREEIYVKHYDHGVGRFTLPRKIAASQVVIVNGLHASLIPGSELVDLKIFLSMEDDLRIQLKIERDLLQRKHSDEIEIRKSIESRTPHYGSFILPQAETSDIQFHIKRVSTNPLKLSITATSADSAFIHELRRSFNSISDTPVIFKKDGNLSCLEIDPENFKREDALIILKENVDSVDQLFSSDPQFSNGSVGVLSLIAILALVRKRTNHVQAS